MFELKPIYDKELSIVSYKKREVKLTGKESLLFMALLNFNHQGVMSKHRLAEEVWPNKYEYISDNNILQIISQLRKKLNTLYHDSSISNVAGEGYILQYPFSKTRVISDARRLSHRIAKIFTFV